MEMKMSESDVIRKMLREYEKDTKEEESLEDIANDIEIYANPLKDFSTTQLKKELQRRKKSDQYSRSGRKHIKDSTELSGGHLW